ncbi:hypothetical protein ACMYQ1_10215 [Shewanella oncorhynchi]|uniref:hypothetical protein n=1 Tax=Shewanella oncorhynchi TaxID=2726434 RepID=UPI0039EF58C0
MEQEFLDKIDDLWELCGPIDGARTVDDLKMDISKSSNIIAPCRDWISKRNKLRNIKKTPDSYRLKTEVEGELNTWIPHSVFVFAAFLEGVKMTRSYLSRDVYVVSTNIGTLI